ncbi:hypothetical protein LTR37_021027 [Vermiconidia calcicola]|uniref:Uncharacterized protein n=1 Tax=Vermiconidia calcicola TaxID=1690605 RepID=A0ACC3M9X1_9PEZI|nr:hypothetical protein LTR37_021027 [Vermiconidia calcicola]
MHRSFASNIKKDKVRWGRTWAYTRQNSNRMFGWLAISPGSRTLSTFGPVKELLTSLRDAMRGHRSLYIEGKTLYRDISENNVIATEPASVGGFTGMLIDLDLARVVGNSQNSTQGPLTIAEAKRGYMHFGGLEDILKEFPEALEGAKLLRREIRAILFPLHQSGGLDAGTHTRAGDLCAKIMGACDESLATWSVHTLS